MPPKSIKRMEGILYTNSSCIDEYLDPSTLKTRLSAIVNNDNNDDEPMLETIPFVSLEHEKLKSGQRMLLLMRHCINCKRECTTKSWCTYGKKLWSHIRLCKDDSCEFPRCNGSLRLLQHHTKCLVSAFKEFITSAIHYSHVP